MTRILSILFLVWAVGAGAADRYAVQGGSGSGCTVGSPCSITTALSGASPGDEIIVDSSGGAITSNLDTSVAGTAGNRIVIRNKDGQTPHINANVVIDLDYYDVRGLEIKYLKLEATANNCLIRSNHFTGQVFYKVEVRGSDNEFHHNLYDTGRNVGGVAMLWLVSSAERNLFHHETFDDNEGHDYVRIYGRFNRFYECEFKNQVSGPEAGHDDHSDIFQTFTSSSGTVCQSNYVERCVFLNNNSQLGNFTNQHDSESMGWVFFYNNIFDGAKIHMNNYLPGVRFENNTVVGASGDTGFRFANGSHGTATGGYFRNNILLRMGGNEAGAGVVQSLGDTIVANNIITDTDDSSKSSFSTGTGNTNGGYTPAQVLVDWANDDFSLVAGSPAIGSALNLTADGIFDDDYNQDARHPTDPWDMGAIVYNATPAPSAPSTLTATTLDFSRINLGWENVANETGYKIERSTTSGSGFVQIATTGADVNAYQDAGLAESTTYYYRVRAYNAGGNSAYTAEDSATTPAASPPPPASGAGRRVRGAVTGAAGGIAP